jgi:hypothetical protein
VIKSTIFAFYFPSKTSDFMHTLSTFFCDWGAADSNWLLFFQLGSFLLGGLLGWVLWRKPLQHALGNINDLEANGIAAHQQEMERIQVDLQRARLAAEDAKARAQRLEEEKGFLRADLYKARNK